MLKKTWPFIVSLVVLLLLSGIIVCVALLFQSKPDHAMVSYVLLGGGLFAALGLMAILTYVFITRVQWGLKDPQPVLVLGESNAGKDLLVEKYIDPHLAQTIYPQVVPSAVLRDNAARARGKTQRLWIPRFASHVPRVVIALNGADLATLPAAELTALAERMKDKVESLVSFRKSAQVDIALTCMEHIDGYAAFAELLVHKRVPLTLHALTSLESQLSPYTKYLSSALTTLSADHFLGFLAFLHHAPQRLAPLSDFVKVFQELPGHDRMRLFFTSSQAIERTISNPFAAA